jgi:hypothetical protein
MGYTTTFTGSLLFTSEPTAKQLAKLNSMFGEDCRDHKEWETGTGLYYVDLKLTDEFTGIEWNGAEKTYDLDKLVNVVIREMRKEFPEFGLTGTLLAQGEDAEDRWQLVIGDDGLAQRIKVQIVGTKVKCPSCEHSFFIEQ